jgi:hypothetical protein
MEIIIIITIIILLTYGNFMSDKTKEEELKELREIQARAKECHHPDNGYMPWDIRFWTYKETRFGIEKPVNNS